MFNNADWLIASDIFVKQPLENLVTKPILVWMLYGWPKKNKFAEFDLCFRRQTQLLVQKIVYCEEMEFLHQIKVMILY